MALPKLGPLVESGPTKGRLSFGRKLQREEDVYSPLQVVSLSTIRKHDNDLGDHLETHLIGVYRNCLVPSLQELNVRVPGILSAICETLGSLKSAVVEALHHGNWQRLYIMALSH